MIRRTHPFPISTVPSFTALATLAGLLGCASDASTSDGTATTTEDALTGAVSFPGRFQAENYLGGGEGVGYHDTTTANLGGAYRSDGVDIEATTDTGGAYDVGWTEPGEWLAYQASVTTAGTYAFTARVASGATGTKTLHLVVDGKAEPAVSFTDSSGWQSWRNVSLGEVSLTAGTHAVRVAFDTDHVNLDYVDVATSTPVCTVSSKLVPSCGAWFGAYEKRRSGETLTQAVARGETWAGRKYDVVHVYHDWTGGFPTAEEQSLAAGGRYLFLNWENRYFSGGGVSWADIAAGKQDAAIDAVGASLKAFGKKAFLSFEHEAEDNVGPMDGVSHWGSASDYVAAFRHVHDRLVSVDGVTNAVFVWVAMGTPLYANYDTDVENGGLYPGDAWVDWIAQDAYNGIQPVPCASSFTWKTFAEITNRASSTFPGFYTWASTQHPSKPQMIGEFGTREDIMAATPTKGDWFRQVPAQASADRPALKAIVYFDSHTDCEWPVDTSTDSLAGYKTLGLAPYFNQPH